MKRNEKQAQIYFRLDDKLVQKLDRRITRAGFSSRRDFFTAVSYAALYGDETANQTQTDEEKQNLANLPEHLKTWLHHTMPRITEEQIQTELHAVIQEMLFAVIAMKGVDVAFENTWEDVRAAFHERTDVWVTESDIREAYASFAAIKKAELTNYRETQLQADH